MKTVNITFRVEEELKKNAEELFADLGMTMSAAYTIFLRQAVREQRLPFAVTRSASASLSAPASPKEPVIERKETVLYGPFDTVSALMEALNA